MKQNPKNLLSSDGFKKIVKKSPIWVPMGVGMYTMGKGVNDLFNKTIGVRHHLAENRKKQQNIEQLSALRQMNEELDSLKGDSND